MEPRVFISYRRSDTRMVAGRLRDHLAVAFGDANVFFDVESIEFGQDFRDVIRSTVAAADAVVLLIGSGFDPARLAEPHDFIRLELLDAFRLGKTVVPVLVEGASMPGSDVLPPELESLSFRNAAPLRPDPDFRPDADRIVEGLRQVGRRASLPRLRASTESGVVLADPSDSQLFDLLVAIQAGDETFFVIERSDDSQTFAQVIQDGDGGWIVERRDGDAEHHYSVTVPDMRSAYQVLAAWAGGRLNPPANAWTRLTIE